MVGSSVIAIVSYFAGVAVFKKIEFISDAIPGLKGLQKVLSHKYYIDELYGIIVINPVKKISAFAGGIIDKYVFDGAVNGIGRGVRAVGGTLRAIQTGDLQTYGLLMLGGLLVTILFIFKVLV
jgi:NADH-quinone oxidoreductase subunit L